VSGYSFRWQLALRFAAAVVLGMIAISVVSYHVVRHVLDRELDASLFNVASIQAASVTDAPGGTMRFHEWELTPAEAASVRDLNRYAQVWSADAESLLRTRYITDDLPLDTTALHSAARGQLVLTEQTFQERPIRSLYYPLERLGPLHANHVLQVAAPLDARNRMGPMWRTIPSGASCGSSRAISRNACCPISSALGHSGQIDAVCAAGRTGDGTESNCTRTG
jgi:hypothetical protein